MIKRLIFTVIIGFTAGLLAVFTAYLYVAPQLPSVDVLRHVQYQVPLSIYSRDGKLIAEYGEKKRRPLAIEQIPKPLIQAFLAAEDHNFYNHPGVDYKGLLRATFKLLKTGEKRQGGSTITMQVARNFFLSRKKTFTRKIKEIFLALKIEQELSKAEILNLYLNKIYLGHRSYGVEAAAYVYYGKTVSELNLAENAMIAGLPKAPSSYNPVTAPKRALRRRNEILRRMHRFRYISDRQYQQALKQPMTARRHSYEVGLEAPYIAEMVRDAMVQRYGAEAYTSGYHVITTIDSRLQNTAYSALYQALHEYDERHGYRPSERTLENALRQTSDEWDAYLDKQPDLGATRAGIVLSVKPRSAIVYTGQQQSIELDWDNLRWARPYHSTHRTGSAPRQASDILQSGDLVRIRKTEAGHWRLAQVPQPDGALVSLNPDTGALLALVGGYDFHRNEFNRATQAQRQPGSGFKPILYTTALEQGYTAASVINDAPIVRYNPGSGKEWRPQNYSGRFYGPTRLRVALQHSRNLVSIRLLQQIGVNKVIQTGKRFGFSPKQLPHADSLALGSGAASPVDMARMFATFANGGFRIEPYFIDRIESITGALVFQSEPETACRNCTEEQLKTLKNPALRVITPEVHYIMNSLLQDVVKRGTARKALKLARNDLAGKTGTTNDQRDAWFNGYCPAQVAIAWVGFDSAKPLGNKETGGKAALPAWMYYMEQALADVPEQFFDQPDTLVSVRIDPETGLRANQHTQGAVLEIFNPPFIPRQTARYYGVDPAGAADLDTPDMQSLF